MKRPLTEQALAFRRLVVRLDGDTMAIARACGVGRTAISQRLNADQHKAWWQALKKERSRLRKRNRGQRKRLRAMIRDVQQQGVAAVQDFSMNIARNLGRIAAYRGITSANLETRARQGVASTQPEIVSMVFGGTKRWLLHEHPYEVADVILDVVGALGLEAGPVELTRAYNVEQSWDD